MRKVITKKEFDVLQLHVRRDISYGEDGTFSKVDKKGDWPFDKKEAAIVERILSKLDAHVRGTTEGKDRHG